MAFEWLVKLNDMVSDPATRIARKLHDVEQQLLAIDYAVKRRNLALMNPGIKKDIAALEVEAVKLRLLGGEISKLDRVSSSLVARFRHLRESTRDWLLILTPLAMGLKFIFNQAQSLAHAIIAPIRAVEEAGIGLKTMYGGKIGDKIVQDMQDLGPRIGRPIAEIFQQAIKFSTSGAPAEFIRPLILAMADMQAMGKDVGKLGYDLAAGFSRPVADLNEMRRGLTGVVDEAKVWDRLAKNMGVSIGNVNFLMSKNLIAGREFSIAVLEVIQEMQGGKLGTKAFERADTTLGGMIDRLEARMEKLFMGIADTPGFATLKKAMMNLIDVFGSADTQRMVNDVANSIGKMLEPLTGPEGKKNMEAFFTSMKVMIDALLPGLNLAGRFIGYMINNTAANLIAREQRRDIRGNFRSWAIHNDIETMNWQYPMGEGAEVPVMGPYQKNGAIPPLNVSIPITIHADTAAKYQDLLPDELKMEILGKVSDAIDQINTQSGESSGGVP